jgi:hypothetical protein
MIPPDQIHTVTEGAEPLPFKYDGELPPRAQVQVASDAPYVVSFQSNPLDVSEGQFVFGRAGLTKVVLTWHTESGVYIARRSQHFSVQPGHWTAEEPTAR